MVKSLLNLKKSDFKLTDYIERKQQRGGSQQEFLESNKQVVTQTYVVPILISPDSKVTPFINDFSRKTWIYFLGKKLEAFEVFQKFKVLFEKKSSRKILFEI